MSTEVVPSRGLTKEEVQELAEARAVELLSWTALTKRFNERNNRNVDWRTVQSNVLSVAGASTLQARTSKRERAHLEEVIEKLNLAKIVMYLLSQRFSEWSILNDRMHLAYMTIGADPGGDEEKAAAPRVTFTQADQVRMDRLWQDVMSFFFQGATLMKESKVSEPNVLAVILGNVVQNNVAVAAPGGKASAGGLPDLAAFTKEIDATTKQILTGIIEKQALESKGRFRAIPEEEESLDKVD